MNPRKSLTVLLAVSLIALILPAVAMAQSIEVECAYNTGSIVPPNGEVDCEVYAYTGTDSLRSGGIQLNTTNCTATEATKNRDIWFLGASSPGLDYPNSPDITTDPKKPNVIVGQFDTSGTITGVSGSRVLMGTVKFTRDNAQFPDITASLAREDVSTDFVSFVDAGSGDSLDGTYGSNINVTIKQRGDANGDDSVDFGDFGATRFFMLNGGVMHPWIDCNANGAIEFGDFGCIRFTQLNP